ncbi:MAG TPA: S8 family serine peptidase [Bacteroidota bacterium]|nr:S8 family serine peptidase [Bacteroidota bacterium]
MKFLPVWIAALMLNSIPASAGQGRYWVHFLDRGPASSASATASDLGARALQRRSKVLPHGSLVGPEDFPLHGPYLEALAALGVSVVTESRWMNAVSAVIPPRALPAVESLPFVERVAPVLKVSRGTPAVTVETRGASSAAMAGIEDPDYGPSFAQLDAVRVPALHALGITGRGVIVGLLDSGYRWRGHRSLAGMRVLKEYDFISRDGDTSDGPGDPPGEDAHGTLVLSVLGGYAPGRLIGPAFGSEYLLAKTEYVPAETQVEEDYWAAGIEWLEANGADVVNSSVGYDTWDDGSGYSWGNGDFDGNTSVVARAAQRAARLGVVLCISMGNEGNGDGVTGTMLTPADVDTAISAGAASFDGLLSTSSSTGPTSDGRIKPDVTAPGVGVYSASTGGFDSYSYQSGTSLASPMAAGAAALLLSARPELTPVRVRDILRASADTARIRNYSTFPNNFTGWGYLDALSSVLGVGLVFSNRPGVGPAPDGAVISVNVISGSGVKPDSVLLWYRDDREAGAVPDTLAMAIDSAFLFPGSGRYTTKVPPHPPGTPISFGITAVDSAGSAYRSPAPLFHDRWILSYGSGEVEEPVEIPSSMRLLQNYPNPFNSETNIVFDLPADGFVGVEIFNVLGELVATPFGDYLDAGGYGSRAPVVFRAGSLPSGVYLCRLTSPAGAVVKKMMLMK